MHTFLVGDYSIGAQAPFTLISGPCVIEGRDHALETATFLTQLAAKHNVQLIYKSSFDKANRSSRSSFRGPGLDEGLRILQEVKESCGVPVLSDIHLPEQAAPAAEVLDIVQIPAFLCRQTDLLIAAAETGKPVSIKKGQFMAPWDMEHAVKKLEASGCHKIILTERGASFGYNNLVSDMRSIPIMQAFGYPVCFDASHSVMLPGGAGEQSGGMREFIPTLSMAAIAAGANLIFMETHPHPAQAKSDAHSVFPFDEIEPLLQKLIGLYDYVASL